jgi:hypothetical protein
MGDQDAVRGAGMAPVRARSAGVRCALPAQVDTRLPGRLPGGC